MKILLRLNLSFWKKVYLKLDFLELRSRYFGKKKTWKLWVQLYILKSLRIRFLLIGEKQSKRWKSPSIVGEFFDRWSQNCQIVRIWIIIRGLDIGFFPLGSIRLTHCCYNIVDTPFTKTVLDFSRKISKEKNDILLDLQTSDKNTHQYIFSKIKMYDFFHILAFPYIKKEHLPICYTQWCKVY